MTKLHGGALVCGLTLAVLSVVQAVPAYADTADSAVPASAPATAAAKPSAAPASASPTPAASAEPTDAATPKPHPSATATPEPSATQTPEPTESPSAEATPTADVQTEPTPEPTASPTALAATPDGPASTYIVGFRSDVGQADAVLGERQARTLNSLDAAVTRLTRAEATALADDPSVAYVQKNTRVHVADSQADPPWGLDRIDQADRPLDNSYTVNRTGAGVTVYVVDTGISAGNAEFDGRVADGVSYVPDGLGTADCNGHGTHVAGTVAGTTFGVAKQATIVPVRVLGCDGEGPADWTVQGLNWVLEQHHRGDPAVVNLSLSGPANQAEDDAVRRLIAEGVTVVVAAGNKVDDACNYSPGSVKGALTVAASDQNDLRWLQSNYGRCVDLYAPGVAIPSAGLSGTDPVVKTGTSMAAPHVAGVAALVLSAHPSWNASKVSARILELSLSGRVGDNMPDTTGRLLNIAPHVDSVSPAVGSVTGDQRITITGSNFLGVTQVLVGGVAATKVDVVSASVIRATTPPGADAASVHLKVVTELSDSNRDLTFDYRPGPVIDVLSASTGPIRGGVEVTITGSHLGEATAVRFGSRKAHSLTVVSDTELRVVTPRNPKGTVRVRVETPLGTTAKVAQSEFRYGYLPKVQKVSSRNGLTIGGARLKITGKHLARVTSVDFGGALGVDLKAVSTKRLLVTVPAHAEGPVNIRLVNRYGVSPLRAQGSYTFAVAPAPSIAAVSPASGWGVGGAEVTITGQDFHGITAVTFGDQSAEIRSACATKLVVVAPPNAAGQVGVRVTGAYGTSADPAPSFTYLETPAPEVLSVTPDGGPTDGGTRVTITGRNFYVVSEVDFGGLAGTDLAIVSSTKLRVTAPAQAVGTVDVVVVAEPYLASALSLKARYTYV